MAAGGKADGQHPHTGLRQLRNRRVGVHPASSGPLLSNLAAQGRCHRRGHMPPSVRPVGRSEVYQSRRRQQVVAAGQHGCPRQRPPDRFAGRSRPAMCFVSAHFCPVAASTAGGGMTGQRVRGPHGHRVRKRNQHAGQATSGLGGSSLIAAPALRLSGKPCPRCPGKKIRTKDPSPHDQEHRQGGFVDISHLRDPSCLG